MEKVTLPEMPIRIARLPKNDAGYPVPWFVAWVDGKPDFRVMDGLKLDHCLRSRCCWICGETMGTYKAFVIGPMCAINRISGEPPSHTDCAIFAAKACPFLTNPKQIRRGTNLPAETLPTSGGIMIPRNPGVALVWVTHTYKVIPDGSGGILFQVGNPERTYWLKYGRSATRDEVLASIESGLPILREMAEKDGPAAVLELIKKTEEAMDLLPVEVVAGA